MESEYKNKGLAITGVSQLLNTLTSTMKSGGAKPTSIAKVQYAVCIQCGLVLPDEFLLSISDEIVGCYASPSIRRMSLTDKSDILSFANDREYVCTKMIAKELFNINEPDMKFSREINSVLNSVDWLEKISTHRFKEYGKDYKTRAWRNVSYGK